MGSGNNEAQTNTFRIYYSLFAIRYSLSDRTMLGRLNHIAVAVRDIAAASHTYREVLGAQVSEPVPQPEHGVVTAFVILPNTKVELIAPLGDASAIEKFL